MEEAAAVAAKRKAEAAAAERAELRIANDRALRVKARRAEEERLRDREAKEYAEAQAAAAAPAEVGDERRHRGGGDQSPVPPRHLRRGMGGRGEGRVVRVGVVRARW